MEEERPKVGLGVIVIKNPYDVLLGLRKVAHGSGKWAFLGGHLEFFESEKACALRELEEETGLGLRNVELMDNHVCTSTNDFFYKEQKHYITLFMRARHIYGEPQVREPNKCEKWEWFNWNELPSGLFVPIKNLKRRGHNPFE